MNKYARIAANYDQKFRPKAYGQNSQECYQNLGEQIQEQVLSLSMSLEGSDSPQEGYLEKVGRLNNARMRAEEMTLAEMVYSNQPELTANILDLWMESDIHNPELLKLWEAVGTPRPNPRELIGTTWWDYGDDWTQDEKMIHEMDQLEWYQKIDWTDQHLAWKEEYLPQVRERIKLNELWGEDGTSFMEMVAYWRIFLDPQVVDEHRQVSDVVQGLKMLRAFEELAQVPHHPYPNMAHHPQLEELAVMPEPSSR